MSEPQAIGTFQAQYFKLLSADPNTIFQFVVFADRIFMLKIGSALNEIPQVMLKASIGAVGLKNYGMPPLAELRELVKKVNEQKTLGLTSSSIPSREIPLEQIRSARFQKKGVFGKGLHLKTADGEKMFFRFLQPEHEVAAEAILRAALRDRLS